MEKTYFVTSVNPNNTAIETIDGISLLVPTPIIAQIAEYASEEEAIQLYSYIKERMLSYNETLDLKGDIETPRGNLTASDIKDILINLLKSSPADIVLEGLQLVNDFEIFSAPKMLEGVETKDIIDYLISIIKDAYEIRYTTDEEEEYNNRNDDCSYIQAKKDYQEELEERKASR